MKAKPRFDPVKPHVRSRRTFDGTPISCFTAGEVGIILGCSGGKVKKLCNNKRIPFRLLPDSKHRRIDRNALLAFMDKYHCPRENLIAFERCGRANMTDSDAPDAPDAPENTKAR